MNVRAETFFKALADQTRLRCLVLLQQEGELCVCELTHALGMIQPKVSRHLAQLREGGIVSSRREGQWIFYRLHSQLPSWEKQVLRTTARAVADEEPFVSDRQNLADMPDRPRTSCCA
ncbi:MAG TPA: metalloregulator ArsR/SmtB family transcription factor [Gammaproteobacteria bacterium]|nr:metalloregulator ArsR/SmtB family transcription factor [Gammaproteobacteria bacterium]